MITQAQKDLVRGTVPILRAHGLDLTKYFYNRMFTHNPELKNLFNMGNQQNSRQQTALAMAVLAYAENIENPSVLMPVVDGIGNKHTSLNIRPEHYQIVGKHLIASIGEVLGDGASAELLEAWRVAYSQLAQIMSGHEGSIYEKQAAKSGGWTGWRPFIVKEKVIESTEITSFYLYPSDGGDIADFKPGQYLSIRVFLKELNLFQPRQYSISCAPNGRYYRISVKREFAREMNPSGLVSNVLHDTVQAGDIVEASAPAGNFSLQESDNPVVLISGGIGQTPLMAMMESLIDSGSKRAITWVHACRNAEVHAFSQVANKEVQTDRQISRHIFYDSCNDQQAQEGIKEGWIELSKFDQAHLPKGAEYYICGPAFFITKHAKDLMDMGISRGAIHFEEFGPQTLQLDI